MAVQEARNLSPGVKLDRHTMGRGVQHTPGFSFSAYLRSPYITALENEGRLGLAVLDTQLLAVVDEVRSAIKVFFRARAAEAARFHLQAGGRTPERSPYSL